MCWLSGAGWIACTGRGERAEWENDYAGFRGKMPTFGQPRAASLMNRTLLVVVLFILGCQREAGREASREPAAKPDLIELRTPLPEAILVSPLTVEGRARGPWFFEASFPVYLLDASGDTIAVTPAQAQGEWMTPAFVPFKATLTFALPASPTGTLILTKDNPSGLAEHAAELRVPIRFH